VRLHFVMISAGAVVQTEKSGEIRGNVSHWARGREIWTPESTMTKKSNQAVVVTVAGDRPIHEVVRDLKASGLQAPQVLDAIGIVTGSAASNSIAKLKKVRGVQDVSLDHKVDIGPPGAPVS
jgi:hypothetical protein